MVNSTASLLQSALELPAAERAELAAELLASLDDQVIDDDPAEVERLWSEELQRRAQEVADGSVKTETWEDLRQRLSRQVRIG